jgi:hypothetical protein
MQTIDRKFKFIAINPINRKHYTEKDAVVLCAKDMAVVPALRAYQAACEDLGCNQEHIDSIELLITRVSEYQAQVEARIPDTVGEEIPRCIGGLGVD